MGVDTLEERDGTYMTADDAHKYDKAVVGAWLKSVAPKALLGAAGVAGCVGVLGYALDNWDAQQDVYQEGFRHEAPIVGVVDPVGANVAPVMEAAEASDFSTDFLCVASAGAVAVNTVEIADFDNGQIDLTRSDVTITEVSSDTSVLTGVFAQARAGSDAVAHDPIGVCYGDVDLGDGQTARFAAPVYPASISM